MLGLREDISYFRKEDCAGFSEDLHRLITDTDRRWPSEPMWHSSQGFRCTDLGNYPALRKYLKEVQFDAAIGEQQPGIDWIDFKPFGTRLGVFGSKGNPRGQKR
jgi:hypothetical protein